MYLVDTNVLSEARRGNVTAREWLRSAGSCLATFSGPRMPAKCRGCPLYDPGWALEA